MPDLFFYVYNAGSEGAKQLSKALDARIIRQESSKFKGREDKIVINWGNSNMNEEIAKCIVLNPPSAVALVANKLSFFREAYDKISIPDFTTDPNEAFRWLQDGKKVLSREKLNGHSGEGIRVLDSVSCFQGYDTTRAKMFVKYIPKKHEYRVHVMGGEVVDLQRKAINPDISREYVNFNIRNHQNGFIYVRDGVRESCPEEVIQQAIEAIRVSGLDFGAVDVIYNDYRKKAFVLEINTAPGLEGQTLQNYIAGMDTLVKTVTGKNPKIKPMYNIDLDEGTISLSIMTNSLNSAAREFGPPAPRVPNTWRANGTRPLEVIVDELPEPLDPF